MYFNQTSLKTLSAYNWKGIEIYPDFDLKGTGRMTIQIIRSASPAHRN